MEIMAVVEVVEIPYDGPWELCKGQSQQQMDTNNQIAKQQFAAQQQYLQQYNNYVNQLVQGGGYLPGVKSALTSEAINSVPQQYNQIAQQLQTNAASRGISGGGSQPGSGLSTAGLGSLYSAEEQQKSNLLNNITSQGQQNVTAGEAGILNAGLGTGNTGANVIGSATSAANQANQQSGVLGTIIGGGLGVLGNLVKSGRQSLMPDDPQQVQSTPTTDMLANSGAFNAPPPPPQEQQMIPASTTLTPPLGTPPPQGGAPPAQLPPRPPGTGVASQPPPSKAEFFRNMLGNFFYSVGTGLANRGSGPDADIRGAGAAMTALPNRDIMQRQLQIQEENAQASKALKEAQADMYTRVPVTINGQSMMLPATAAKQILAAQATGASRENVAKTNAEAKVDTAKIATTAGQVTITDGVAKSLGLDPTMVGKNLNPAQIKALTPRITPPNLLSLIDKANKGDKDAQAILDTKQKMDESLAKARGLGFGAGRAQYTFRMFYDPETQETYPLSSMDAAKALQQGKNLIMTGNLPQDKIIAVQQLQSEATPALKNFESAAKSFDNPNDRAIFARVMKGAGEPARGDESTWLGNVFNQAAKEGLSPDGMKIATQYGPRLAETMGRLRSTLGLQATDSAMALTLRLIPGGSTPNSETAMGQLKQIREMIDQATGIPAFHGKKSGPDAKQGGSVVDQLAQKYGAH